MRSARHWTPKYVRDRLRLLLHDWASPDDPWFTQQATWLLARLLKPDDVGLEWGSGKSTLWFARRVAKLLSVEHSETWYRKVQSRLRRAGILNVDYRFVPVDDGTPITAWGKSGIYRIDNPRAGAPEDGGRIVTATNRYAEVVEEAAPDSLGFVLVDGLYRGECALRSLQKLRPGGIMIVDNINWFLPSASSAPGSRPVDGALASEEWAEFSRRVQDWRRVWTSNGVSDTAIWLKP